MTDRRAEVELELEYLEASEAFIKAKKKGRGAEYEKAKGKMSKLRTYWRQIREANTPAAGEARPAPVAASAQVKGG